ncbi:hypothetical protein MMC12_005820 [Toensbergia leucococca]|nr:hypothetical protein [Toensbergia leucococca]
MGKSRISKQPSHYPPLAFHLIRLGQILSSIVVASVLFFFIHHLEIEHYNIPWTFLLLLFVSLLTKLTIVTTSIFYHFRTLPPKLNLFSNLGLLVLWMLGFALLAWNLSGTLSHRCTTANWSNEAGIMVCRLYKALTAFAITGLTTTLCAVLLDLRTYRLTTHRGKYNPMMDIKHPFPISSPSNPHDPYQPPRDIPEFSHEITKPYKVQQTIEVQQFGYSAPSEQTTYDGAGSVHLHGAYGNGGAF